MGRFLHPYMQIRATSHMRLRAHDHHISSTLIGGKGGVGPSSLHITLKGPTEFVNARWIKRLHGFLHGIEWIMLHGHLDYFHKTIFEVGLTQNRRPWHPELSQPWKCSISSCRGPACMKYIEIAFGRRSCHIWLRTTLEGPWPHSMILEVCWDGLWTLSFGLSQFHGHGLTALGSCVKWPLGRPTRMLYIAYTFPSMS
jgi:hypothetical protein